MSNALAVTTAIEPRPKPLALIVEDREFEREGMIALVEKAGFKAHAADGYASAAAWLKEEAHHLDLLVVDLWLPEVNLGWRVIAEAKSQVPWWCEIVVLTAHDETRPAAASAGVSFFKKGTGEFAYGFTEKIAACSKTFQSRLDGVDGSGPEVKTGKLDKDLDYEERMMCRAISDARQVEVIRRLKGSLQEGAVLQVKLTPKGEAPDCIAVVKRGGVKKADDEVAGQEKLMWYWSKIGRALPPLRKYRSLLSSRERVLVTPFAGGRTLAEAAADNWYRDHEGRVQTFQAIFSAAAGFLETINRSRECKHGVAETFTSAYLGTDEKAVGRKDKALSVLHSLIGTDAAMVRCVSSSVIAPNPLMLFQKMQEQDDGVCWRWRPGESICGVVTYGHGDFHVGNVMMDLSKTGRIKRGGLTILDYDYVGEYCRHYDTAQLESSFLIELALAFEEQLGAAKWDGYYLPALKVLTSAEREESIANNEFACDLVRVVRTLRGGLAAPDLTLYHGALFTTLLRISVSKYLKLKGALPRSAKRTVVVTLGLLLNQLGGVNRPVNELAVADVEM
jgi:CheY-like chemotaxis protein